MVFWDPIYIYCNTSVECAMELDTKLINVYRITRMVKNVNAMVQEILLPKKPQTYDFL